MSVGVHWRSKLQCGYKEGNWVYLGWNWVYLGSPFCICEHWSLRELSVNTNPELHHGEVWELSSPCMRLCVHWECTSHAYMVLWCTPVHKYGVFDSHFSDGHFCRQSALYIENTASECGPGGGTCSRGIHKRRHALCEESNGLISWGCSCNIFGLVFTKLTSEHL